MKSIVLAVLTVSSVAFAKPPTCRERVKSLSDLAATAAAKRDASFKGPAVLPIYKLEELDAALAGQEAWKERGVRLTTNAKDEVTADQAKAAAALNKLLGATTVELCVDQNAPMESMASKDASPKVLAPLVKMASEMEPVDRATVLASELGAKKVKCKGIKETVEAVAHASRADRLAMLLQGAVESLEPCKCSAADVERVYAVMTLISDVWDDKQVCVKVLAPKDGAGATVEVKGKWSAVADALGKASTGVTFR